MQEIEIVHDAKDWVLINKPAGLAVHNAEAGDHLLSILQKQLKLEVSPVHRLDKETNGLILLAKNKTAAQELQPLFETKAIKKVYHAVLRGNIPITETWQKWSWPLTDKAEGRKNPQGISADRKPCETLFRVLKNNKYFSFVECEILTGRQHQIRKHSVLAKHAIVGDLRYGEQKYNQMVLERYPSFCRMALEAHSLEWTYKGEKFYFELPMNQDFLSLVAELC